MDCSLKILSDLSILSVFQGTSVPPLFDTDPSPSYFRLLLAATTPLEWSSLRVALEHHFGSVDNVQRSAVYSGWLGVEMVVEAFRRLDQRAAGEYEVRRWLAALWMAVVQQSLLHHDGSGRLQSVLSSLHCTGGLAAQKQLMYQTLFAIRSSSPSPEPTILPSPSHQPSQHFPFDDTATAASHALSQGLSQLTLAT